MFLLFLEKYSGIFLFIALTILPPLLISFREKTENQRLAVVFIGVTIWYATQEPHLDKIIYMAIAFGLSYLAITKMKRFGFIIALIIIAIYLTTDKILLT